MFALRVNLGNFFQYIFKGYEREFRKKRGTESLIFLAPLQHCKPLPHD